MAYKSKGCMSKSSVAFSALPEHEQVSREPKPVHLREWDIPMYLLAPK